MIDFGARRPDLVGFEAAYVERRNRGTVAVRVILAIPQLIVVAILGIAAYVVVIIGWFAALVLGRMPGWAAEFLAGYVGWVTRTVAYLYLLVDAHPPFELAATPGYPVRVSIPPPGQLNRAAVFFRVILVLPAYVVGASAITGLAVASVAVWVILIVGLAANVASYVYRGTEFGLSYTQLVTAHEQFVSAHDQALSMLDSCQTSNPTLSCVELAYSAEGAAYSNFAASLDSISFPSNAADDGNALLAEVRLAGEEFQDVAGASSETEFNAEVTQRHLKTLAQRVNQDYTRLSTLLSSTP